MAAHQDYAMARAHLLISSYRIVGGKDVSKPMMALGLVLALFPESVIAEATSPVTGIQTLPQFASQPPKPTELKAYCKALTDHRQPLPADFRPRPYSRHWHEPERPAPSEKDRARVAAALAAFQRGIKPTEESPRRQWHPPTDAELLAHYGRRPSLAPIPFE